MKFFYLVFIVLSLGHADWTKEVYEKSNSLYEKVKEESINLVTSKKLSKDETKQIHLNTVWKNSFDDLEDGAKYIAKLDNAPNSAWLRKDKKDVQKDINKLLDDMIKTITGDSLTIYKKEIANLQDSIEQNKADMITYREKKISAPIESKIYTTKANYDEKIEHKKLENKQLESKVINVKNKLKDNFSDIGVTLTSKQIDVLLARVDGDDIIQMALVMDMLNYITTQIMGLMKESNEELSQAKKYYAMHLITLELVVYIQQKYIDKVDNIYIPKIDAIIDTSSNMMNETNSLRGAEEDNRKREVYAKNLKAQELALKLATRYKKDLIDSKKRMINAQDKSKSNLTLSRNTYQTVMVNVVLYDLMTESQNMFIEVSKIQMPNIVPFENTQMQNKYIELTKSIKNSK